MSDSPVSTLWLESRAVDEFCRKHRHSHISGKDIREFCEKRVDAGPANAFQFFLCATLLYTVYSWPRKRGRKPKLQEETNDEETEPGIWRPFRIRLDTRWKRCLAFPESGKHRCILAPMVFHDDAHFYCHPSECSGEFKIGIAAEDIKTSTAGDYRIEAMKRLLKGNSPTGLSAPLEQLKLLGLAAKKGGIWNWDRFRKLSGPNFERDFTRNALKHDPQFRRLILTTEYLEGSEDPREFLTFDYDEPNAKLRQESNNPLCRYSFLNYRAIENFVVSFSAYNTVIGYYFRRGAVAGGQICPNRAETFLTCHADSLQNLLSSEKELREHFHNHTKIEKTRMHQAFLNLKAGSPFEEALSKLKEASASTFILDLSKRVRCPSNMFVITNMPVDLTHLCDFLEERIVAYEHFVYYPELRFEVCKHLGLAFKQFDSAFLLILKREWRESHNIMAFLQGIGIQDQSHQISNDLFDHFGRAFDTLQIQW